MKSKIKRKWVIGVDEAGRGPLAGPVAVGAVLVPYDFDFSRFSKVADSKKMTEAARERTYKEVRTLARRGDIRCAVVLVPATTIDTIGITKAVLQGVARACSKLKAEHHSVEVRLDGLLRAPVAFTHQRTIIKGDVTEPAISLASIMAKVTRDRRMVLLSKKHPEYGFEVHKGYGTKNHQDALKQYGLSGQHRSTFCKKWL